MNKKIPYIIAIAIITPLAFYVYDEFSKMKLYTKFTEQDMLAFEREFFDLSNQERIKAGVPSLEWDEQLHKIAREHSEDMLENSFYSHINPQGQDSTERGKEVGYECVNVVNDGKYTGIAENIGGFTFMGDYLYDETDEERLIKNLKESPLHYQNLISESHETMAIGVAINQDHLRLTQNFC